MRRRAVLSAVAVSVGGIAGCSSSGGTEENGSSSLPQTDSGPSSETLGAIIGNYRSGYNGVESSLELLTTAVDSMNNGNYGLAKMSLQNFGSNTRTFVNAFDEAATKATDINEDEIAAAARSGKREAELLIEASDYLRETAVASENQNWDRAENKTAQAQAVMRNARDAHRDLLKPSTVESRLMAEV